MTDTQPPKAVATGSAFKWIRPTDAEWELWNAWNGRILVMTSEGPEIVYVPEDSYPYYEHADELAEPDEWLAWSRIPCVEKSDSADAARRALYDLIQGEVDRRIRAYFEGEWAILRVPRRSVPEGAELAECYQTAKEWIIIGTPDSEDETHNCDAMGCSTATHVMARIPRLNTELTDRHE